MEDVEIGQARYGEMGRVGELVYEVDDYIYPTLFGDRVVARDVMPRLALVPNSPFAREHVTVAREAGEVVGVVVAYRHVFYRTPELVRFCIEEHALPLSAVDVCNRYLLPMCSFVMDDDVYVSCLAVDERHRRQGVARALMRHVMDGAGGRCVKLDALADNVAALHLYGSLGFEVVGESIGYSHDGVPPRVVLMRTGVCGHE
jgi:ribosomal protein S18 acetylase RimI-like enzyme